MSNSLDSFLTRIGDVTIERVNPRGNPRPSEATSQSQPEVQLSAIHNERDPRLGVDESSEESSGDLSDSEMSHKNKSDISLQPEEIEEIRDEGSADDMDLDETIDSHIGVRMESNRRDESINDEEDLNDDDDDDDIEAVDILENLPLEGAPIEGQEVTEADLLGKPISKDMDDIESEDNDISKTDQNSASEDGVDTNKRQLDSDNMDSLSKKQKMDDGNEESGTECETKQVDKKMANMRRNIREVMDETQLDEATLAAQRQEMERLRRVQEQQRIIREVQRQFTVNRQSSKGQQRAVSLLQGKQSLAGTTISPSTQLSSQPSSSSMSGIVSQTRTPSTILTKVNSGSGSGSSTQIHSPGAQPSSAQMPNRPMQDSRWQRGRAPPYQTAQTSISRVLSNRANMNSNMLQQRIRMMTPSVSISPVVPKKEPRRRVEFFSDSECSDMEGEEELREKQIQTMRKLSSSSKSPKSPKGKELVTISSSSESSDDDCIVLSDPSADEESDNEDDPSNSGMHTNDRYNVPDDQGRVLVNVGHPESEPDVFLAPQVARIIKPHQIGGIRFLYDNIVESIERFKTSSGFGCILAHSMGLGKTLQVASFCDIFFRCTSAKTVLCIMPINTLQNWLAEFNMWLPYEDPNAIKTDAVNVKEESISDSIKLEIKEENPSNSSSHSNPLPSADNNGKVNSFQHQGFDNRNTMNNFSSENESNLYNITQDANMYGTNFSQLSRPPQYGSNFSPGIPGTNQPSMFPDYVDNNQQMSMYPNYDNQRFMNYPSTNTGEIKKEDIPQVKKEFEENIDLKAKDDIKVEKKFQDKAKTPFSVDAPSELEIRPRHFHLHILNDSHKSMAARARVIKAWQKDGGVLMIGYELYRQLSLKKPTKSKRKRGQPFKEAVDVEEEDKNKGLLDEMHIALVNPGPDLVICDEGHRIKNSHASISLALKQMRTKRRIVLTGYPLQNNLLEYWCMVDFVRPNYLGTKSEFCNMFERPIQNGQCIDSTPQDIRLMRYRAHVLHALLEGFVQRRSHSVLQVSLPRKEEYIMLVRMTAFQRNLYDTFMNQVVKTRAVPNPLKAFAVCCKIWNHPDILYHFLRKKQANEEDDLDLEETIGEKPAAGAKRSKARQPKGESKKGKKGEKAVKNKPAASVQPNSSGSSTQTNNPEPVAEVTATPDSVTNNNNSNSSKSTNSNLVNKKSFQNNFPVPMQNTANYTNTQNTTSNQQYPNTAPPAQEYQNYRPNEQSNYYPNEGNQEYNDFYNNNQSFQQYPANSNYNSGQIYQNQSSNYITNAEQRVPGSNHQSTRYPPPTSATTNEFRPDQTHNQNYDQSGVFPRQQGYTSYQDRPGRNYNSNVTQSPTYQQQSSNFQNQIPLQDFQHNTTYPNQSQTFTSQNNQQNQNLSFNSNSNPGNNQSVPQNTITQNTSSYINTQRSTTTGSVNQSFTPNSTPQNQNFPTNQQSQNVPLQNYQSTPNNSTTAGFTQNNQPNQRQQPHGYIQGSQTPITSNQIRSYTSTPNSQNITQSSHGYNAQDQIQNTTGTIHGYSQNQPQTQMYQGSRQNTGGNYPVNQNNPAVNTTNPTHRYPPSTSTQQATSLQQNQPVFPPTQQTSNSAPINQTERMFNCGDQAASNANYTSTTNSGPNSTSSYPPNPSQSQPNMQNFSSAENNHPGQSSSFKNQDDQYWQRNYQQPYGPDQKYNEPYFRDDSNSANRYQNNYYPSQNYQNSSFDYAATTASSHDNATKIVEDVKPVTARPGSHPVTSPADKDVNNIAIAQQPKIPTGVSFPPQETGLRGNAPSVNKPVQKTVECKKEEDEKEGYEKEKEEKSDEEIVPKEEEKDLKSSPISKEDPGIPYDWATELMKGYIPGLIDASAKMSLFFCILEEAIRLGDRVLAFSQSLFTLNLIEDFLARNDLKYPDEKTEAWVKNVNYYRLDGSTSALEREKLINEFNSNPKIHLFLVSTRAGSLGINLVGANRAIVFDASWNPCHDTQAVCRVYRYGQQKKCYVYRLVTDNCLERKIYDRQISKQGMADRVVDQCNPDAHLSLKEATTLSWDWEEDSQIQDFSQAKDSYPDPVMHKVLKQFSSLLTKQPFHHESLLVDRKDKKLSQAEKRLARRGYELEKMAANCARPSYNYVPGNTATRGGLQIRAIRGGGTPADAGPAPKPVASVRPMQQRGAEGLGARSMAGSRWIPAEVWQRQGMSAQEMTLPLDVVIPTNSPDKGSIILKAGQRVMVLKSPKGIYMQLESGKIIAIRTAIKLNQQKRDEESRSEPPKKGNAPPQHTSSSLDHKQDTLQPEQHITPSFFSSPGVSSSTSPRSLKQQQQQSAPDVGFPLRNNSAISIIPKSSTSGGQRPLSRSSSGASYRPFDKETARRQRPVVTAAAKPYSSHMNLTNQVSLSRLPRVKQEPIEQASPSGGENSNSSDGQVRTDQRVEEVRLEDVVADVAPHSDYEVVPSSQHARRPPDDDSSSSRMYANVPPEATNISNVPPPVQEMSETVGKRPFSGQKEKDVTVEDVIIEDHTQVIPPAPTRSDGKSDSIAPPVETPKNVQPEVVANRESFQGGEGHMPQGYPYGQYPRYYDYGDPRSRSLSNPYSSYYPGVPPPPPTSTTRSTLDASKTNPQQPEIVKAPEEAIGVNTAKTNVYQQSTEAAPVVNSAKQDSQPEINKPPPENISNTPVANTPRDDGNNANVPGGFAHPSGGHYPGPYPPGPYDPYAQHYTHGPGSSAGYPPGGAPGYPAYGGPSYNADYARMYSAFHGPPPPAADPYIHHRAYAPPPSTHPPNYYPPFPHPPPPPYPNYSFLPPYPNPGTEPQPPAQ